MNDYIYFRLFEKPYLHVSRIVENGLGNSFAQTVCGRTFAAKRGQVMTIEEGDELRHGVKKCGKCLRYERARERIES